MMVAVWRCLDVPVADHRVLAGQIRNSLDCQSLRLTDLDGAILRSLERGSRKAKSDETFSYMKFH